MKHRENSSPRPSDLPEDLSVLERRGHLSEASRRRLELCLASSESLHALHELGHRFDEISDQLPEDRAILRRITARSVQQFAGKSALERWGALPGRKIAWLSFAALLLGTFGAAAALYPHFAPLISSSAPPPSPQSNTSNGTTRPAGSQLSVSAAVPTASTLPSAMGLDPAIGSNEKASKSPLPSPPTQPERRANALDGALSSNVPGALDGPVEAFSAANAARRSGDLTSAVALYRELQSRYPQSEEALLTHIMLGRLELSRGNAGRALVEYEGYLRNAPNGTLAQEALQGKARALHGLGIKDEENRAWRELLLRYPASTYAETAREHLVESP